MSQEPRPLLRAHSFPGEPGPHRMWGLLQGAGALPGDGEAEGGPYTPRHVRDGAQPFLPAPPSLEYPLTPVLPCIATCPCQLSRQLGPGTQEPQPAPEPTSKCGWHLSSSPESTQGAGPSGTRGWRKRGPRPPKSSRKPAGAKPPSHPELPASLKDAIRGLGPLASFLGVATQSLIQSLPLPRRPAHSAHLPQASPPCLWPPPSALSRPGPSVLS